MAVDTGRLRELLDRFEFDQVFISELGWDNPPPGDHPVVVPEDEVVATQIAQKRGVGVWRIDSIPPPPVRRRVDMAVSKLTRERLLVFVGEDEQLWLWPEQRVSGIGYRLVQHNYHPGALNEALLQRLAQASFTLEEEGDLTVMDVLERVRRSFSADEVTKKFYREFKNHHDDLLDEIQGIGDETHNSWYGSVLLNRLMFIYFMQKKGFLDDDRNYLRNRLQMVREHLGPDSFYGFFREFLLPLFHDGLGSHLHNYSDPEIAGIIGDVPYVNGGIFSSHLLEETYQIDVPDEAFEEIFTFFDRYRWHLDERPSDDPNEINPDVLGYIFEQYVNQKEQGAYYTKEDVTGYMATYTIVPALIDRLGNPDDLWILPTIDPGRYIWESTSYGADEPLPDGVSAGLEDESQRDAWSEKASASYGLPGETWCETIDRHRRYRDLRVELEDAQITSPDRAITANIDLRTLVEDYFRMLGTLQELENAWEAISRLTILDPTCGSGAFLFAALEVLAELYDALIDRAIELSTVMDSASYLRSLKDHPNRDYFVMKSALLNNLYGVDIMHEAGEIARLRLFLKLAAQLTKRSELEPLPDLDFNIRAGNLLVGVAHVQDAEERLSQDLIGLSRLGDIETAAIDVADSYEDFVRSQRVSDDPFITSELKVTLSEKLEALRRDVDEYLFEARGETGSPSQWKESHQPFHWFVEFPGVFLEGGFDVVIGNPPYIARRRVTEYSWVGFRTSDCPDIYAICVERSLGLMNSSGRFGMILPHSISFSSRFPDARRAVEDSVDAVWISSYARIPAGLFSADTRVRNSIVVASRSAAKSLLLTTECQRWIEAYRPFLMHNLRYAKPSPALLEDQWPFLGSEELGDALTRLVDRGSQIGHAALNKGNYEPQPGNDGAAGKSGPWAVLFKQTAYNWISVFTEPPPAFGRDGEPIEQSKMGGLWFDDPEVRDAALGMLAGKWGFAWWRVLGDDFDVTATLLSSFPANPRRLSDDKMAEILDAVACLKAEMQENVVFKLNAGKQIGNYNLARCRPITDDIDRLLAIAWGMGPYALEALDRVYYGTIKTDLHQD